MKLTAEHEKNSSNFRLMREFFIKDSPIFLVFPSNILVNIEMGHKEIQLYFQDDTFPVQVS
jgi:hypothetical protein